MERAMQSPDGHSARPAEEDIHSQKEALMNISKDQIVQLLESQGKNDQASQAASELPDKVDTDNAEHAGMLSKYGIDPSSIAGKLGGLGKLL
jgi:hypothetical protein